MWTGCAACPNPPARHLRATRLILFFLIVSFALSLCCVASRNIYDDEHTSLYFVRFSASQIIQAANSSDVHPPGMYLLAHYAFKVIPSPRWMTLFVLILLYAALSLFVFQITPLLATMRGRICFLALVTLSPQLLMWGLTFRWYGWWTPLALIVLVHALQPSVAVQSLRFSYPRAVVIAIMLAVLFYLNYITLLFIMALAAALLLRYGLKPWKHYALTLLLFLLFVSPQLHAFYSVHLAGSQKQRANPFVSFARLLQGTFPSEAYLPWHPVAIAAFLCFAVLSILGAIKAIRAARTLSTAGALLTPHRGLAGVILFALVFFVLLALSGLGMKPRNGLILVPTLAPMFALVVENLPSRAMQSALLMFIFLWEGIGIEHLILRRGLAKSNMNNHPEEVIAYIRQTSPKCSVLVTYDPLLTLTAEESGVDNLLVLAPSESTLSIHRAAFNLNACDPVEIYWVSSYLGGLGDGGKQFAKEMLGSEAVVKARLQSRSFDYDPEAARKRRLTQFRDASDLPDYRYVVQTAQISKAELSVISKQLPDFEDASITRY